MVSVRVLSEGCLEDTSVQNSEVEAWQSLGTLHEGSDRVVLLEVELPDFDGGLGDGPQGLPGGSTLGLIANGENQRVQAQLEQLPGAFEPEAGVEPVMMAVLPLRLTSRGETAGGQMKSWR